MVGSVRCICSTLLRVNKSRPTKAIVLRCLHGYYEYRT
jgi:hypothetical protein